MILRRQKYALLACFVALDLDGLGVGLVAHWDQDVDLLTGGLLRGSFLDFFFGDTFSY